MSSSIAAAKRRRGVIEAPAVPISARQQLSQSDTSSPSSTALTLPQVIQVVDTRLIILEKFMKNTLSETINHRKESEFKEDSIISQSESSSTSLMETQIKTIDSTGKIMNVTIKDMLEDFDKKYELLAEEIINMKNIVLELQAFTMGVSKKMFDRLEDISDSASDILEKSMPTLFLSDTSISLGLSNNEFVTAVEDIDSN